MWCNWLALPSGKYDVIAFEEEVCNGRDCDVISLGMSLLDCYIVQSWTICCVEGTYPSTLLLQGYLFSSGRLLKSISFYCCYFCALSTTEHNTCNHYCIKLSQRIVRYATYNPYRIKLSQRIVRYATYNPYRNKLSQRIVRYATYNPYRIKLSQRIVRYATYNPYRIKLSQRIVRYATYNPYRNKLSQRIVRYATYNPYRIKLSQQIVRCATYNPYRIKLSLGIGRHTNLVTVLNYHSELGSIQLIL